MYNENRLLCSKKDFFFNPVTCCDCQDFLDGKCGPEILNWIINACDGYRVEYTILKKVREIVKYMGITSKNVLDILSQKYGLSLDRTTLIKYRKMGIIDQEKKIGQGRAKGVIVLWNDNTPIKCYFINLLKEKGITLNQLKKYSDLAQIKSPYELHNYTGGPLRAITAETFKERVDIMKFYTVMGYLAAAELKVESPSNYDTKILIDKDNLNQSKIEVILVKEAPDKIVVFSKSGTNVVNAD